jgi:chromosome partitioning protein
MRVIAVANTKGGAGKTTVATHLAAYFARQGASVGLSDLDKQRCADGWIERRPADLPRIRAVELPDDPRDLSKKVDVLVIDVPAGAKRERTEALVLVSHAIVVPVMPSAFDEAGTVRFLERLADLRPVKKGKREVVTVGNRVRPRTRAASRLVAFLAEQRFPPVAMLRDAAVYAEAAALGVSLFDLPPRRAGAALADWAPLIAALSDG